MRPAPMQAAAVLAASAVPVAVPAVAQAPARRRRSPRRDAAAGADTVKSILDAGAERRRRAATPTARRAGAIRS